MDTIWVIVHDHDYEGMSAPITFTEDKEVADAIVNIMNTHGHANFTACDVLKWPNIHYESEINKDEIPF